MAERLWRCCRCCDGIAKDDHVAFGGDVEKDGHELPCDTCRQGSNYAANTTHPPRDARAQSEES